LRDHTRSRRREQARLFLGGEFAEFAELEQRKSSSELKLARIGRESLTKLQCRSKSAGISKVHALQQKPRPLMVTGRRRQPLDPEEGALIQWRACFAIYRDRSVARYRSPKICNRFRSMLQVSWLDRSLGPVTRSFPPPPVPARTLVASCIKCSAAPFAFSTRSSNQHAQRCRPSCTTSSGLHSRECCHDRADRHQECVSCGG
jgi:hypothetical protein